MYASVYGDGHVELTYVTAHTNHQPGSSEDAYLPLSTNTREEIALKLANGIPPERIMEGIIIYYYRYVVQYSYMYNNCT